MGSSGFIAFAACTVLVALISWLKTRKDKRNTTVSLFLANRNNGYWVVGGSLFLSNISANQFIGENESVYVDNLSVIGWGISSVLAMLLVSEYIIPIYLRSGMMTTPDFLEQRYDKGTKRFVSLFFLLSYIFNLLPAVLYGGAVAFTTLFSISGYLHVSYWESIWILVWVIGICGCAYSIIGGLRAITVSDSVLALCMIIIGVVLPLYGLRYLGGGDFVRGVQTLFAGHREHLNSIGGKLDAIPFSTLFTGMLIMNLYYWGMEQYIVQQALAARSLGDCQKGIVVACFAKLLSPLLINVPGLIAVHLYPSMQNPAAVFPTLVRDILPPVFAGLTASVVLGAALTTYNAGLNSSSTLFVLNLYRPWKQKRGADPSESQMIRTSKRFEIIISVTAMLIAPFILFSNAGFYAYLQQVAGMFSIPIFTIIFVGFVTRKVPPVAAKAGMVFFLVCYGICEFALHLDIHFLHLLAILFLLTTLLMLIIGRVCPMQRSFRQQENVLVEMRPWKYRYVVGAFLILLMIGIFVLFSPIGLASRG